MSILERVVRLEAWKEQIDKLIGETQESNRWLVRGVVLVVLGAGLALVKIRSG